MITLIRGFNIALCKSSKLTCRSLAIFWRTESFVIRAWSLFDPSDANSRFPNNNNADRTRNTAETTMVMHIQNKQTFNLFFGKSHNTHSIHCILQFLCIANSWDCEITVCKEAIFGRRMFQKKFFWIKQVISPGGQTSHGLRSTTNQLIENMETSFLDSLSQHAWFF